MAGARPLYLTSGFILEEGFPLADLKRIVESMAKAATEAGVPDRHRRHQGGGEGQGRRRLHQHHRRGRGGRGHRDLRRPRAPRRRDPRLRHPGRPRRGHHVAAREPHLRDDDPVRHGVAAHAGGGHDRGGAHDPLPARSHARRARHDAERDRAPVGRRHAPGGVRHSRARRRWRRPASSSGSTRSTWPTRASSWPSAPARTRERCWPRCARTRWGATPPIVGEVVEDAHHFVQMRTGFGGSRMVDWLAGEQLPRIC